MSSITISLWKGDTKIWDESPNPRPLRFLPDGRVGVVYRGSVFPLRGQNEVDIDDDSEEPTNCPLVGETDDVKQPWYLDESGRRTYLVWRGRKGQVPQVLDALREVGWEGTKADPSKRPASNGIYYDWYVWIPEDLEIPEDDLERTLSAVFQSADEPAEPDEIAEPNPDLVTVSAEELDRLSRRMDDLSKTVLKAKGREKELADLSKADVQRAKKAEASRAAAEQQLAAARLEHGTEIATLRRMLADLEQRLKTAQRPMETAARQGDQEQVEKLHATNRMIVAERDAAVEEMARLQETHSSLKQSHQTCDVLMSDADRSEQALKGNNAMLEQLLVDEQSKSSNYQIEANYWRVQAQARNPQVSKLNIWFRQTKQVFAPSVRFIGEPEAFVFQLADPRSLFETLRDIEAGVAKGKNVEQADGWSELHFSTGSKDDGRIYWSRSGPPWPVLIGDKESQPSDMRRVTKWRPTR